MSAKAAEQNNTNLPALPPPADGKPNTFYLPGTGGKMEGGPHTSRPGEDGKVDPVTKGGFATTLMDVLAARAEGKDIPVTLAAVNGKNAKGKTVGGNFSDSQYGKEYNIPTVTFPGPDGKMVTLTNVRGLVHDRGPGVRGKDAHFDIAMASGQGKSDKEAGRIVSKANFGAPGSLPGKVAGEQGLPPVNETERGKMIEATRGRTTAKQAGLSPKGWDPQNTNWGDMDAKMVDALNRAAADMTPQQRAHFVISGTPRGDPGRDNNAYRAVDRGEAQERGMDPKGSQQDTRARGIAGHYAADTPGRSMHGYGRAVDVVKGPALDFLQKNGAKYGLRGIGKGDPVHIQMVEGRGKIASAPFTPVPPTMPTALADARRGDPTAPQTQVADLPPAPPSLPPPQDALPTAPPVAPQVGPSYGRADAMNPLATAALPPPTDALPYALTAPPAPPAPPPPQSVPPPTPGVPQAPSDAKSADPIGPAVSDALAGKGIDSKDVVGRSVDAAKDAKEAADGGKPTVAQIIDAMQAKGLMSLPAKEVVDIVEAIQQASKETPAVPSQSNQDAKGDKAGRGFDAAHSADFSPATTPQESNAGAKGDNQSKDSFDSRFGDLPAAKDAPAPPAPPPSAPPTPPADAPLGLQSKPGDRGTDATSAPASSEKGTTNPDDVQTVPAAKGIPDRGLQARSAQNIIADHARGKTDQAGFEQAAKDAAKAMARAGIPAAVARSELTDFSLKGAAKAGYGPDSLSYKAGLVTATINSAVNAAMNGYHAAPAGPVQGPPSPVGGPPESIAPPVADALPVEAAPPVVATDNTQAMQAAHDAEVAAWDTVNSLSPSLQSQLGIDSLNPGVPEASPAPPAPQGLIGTGTPATPDNLALPPVDVTPAKPAGTPTPGKDASPEAPPALAPDETTAPPPNAVPSEYGPALSVLGISLSAGPVTVGGGGELRQNGQALGVTVDDLAEAERRIEESAISSTGTRGGVPHMAAGGLVFHYHAAPTPKEPEPKQAGLGQSRAKGGSAGKAEMSPEDDAMEGHRQRFIQGYIRGKRLAERHREMGLKPAHVAGLAQLHHALGGLVDAPGRYADGGGAMPGLDPIDMIEMTRAAQKAAKQTGYAAEVPGFKAPDPLSDVGGPGYAVGGLTDAKMNVLSRGAFTDAGHAKTAAVPKPSPGVHLISSSTPGRNDRIPMRARSGSFIMPADVVSGLGQGNTAAGAKMWGQAIGHGIPQKKPKYPPLMHMKQPKMSSGTPKIGFAEGGEAESESADGYTPIITAGGELVIDPEIVEMLGDGDPEAGRKMLSESVVSVRKQIIDAMKQLPDPIA